MGKNKALEELENSDGAFVVERIIKDLAATGYSVREKSTEFIRKMPAIILDVLKNGSKVGEIWYANTREWDDEFGSWIRRENSGRYYDEEDGDFDLGYFLAVHIDELAVALLSKIATHRDDIPEWLMTSATLIADLNKANNMPINDPEWARDRSGDPTYRNIPRYLNVMFR